MIKIKRDPFYDFQINEDNPADNQIMRKICTMFIILAYAIIGITELCFVRCIDVGYVHFTI